MPMVGRISKASGPTRTALRWSRTIRLNAHKFTVEDPTWYVRPWTGETHFTLSNESLMELACHEGNYSLRFILEAARTLEAAR